MMVPRVMVPFTAQTAAAMPATPHHRIRFDRAMRDPQEVLYASNAFSPRTQIQLRQQGATGRATELAWPRLTDVRNASQT
jgi:hypothetical protein